MKKRVLKDQLNKSSILINDLCSELGAAGKKIDALENEVLDANETIAGLKAQLSDLNEAYGCVSLLCEVQRESLRTAKGMKPVKIIQSRRKGTTVVLWDDGSKTSVKCSEKDEYTPLAGIAIAYLKRILSRKAFRRIFIDSEVNIIDGDAVRDSKNKKSKE